jgi:hypothetical protein
MPVLEGRDKASHPFILDADLPVQEKSDTLQLRLTLIGKAMDYLPYFYYSLKKAGEKGIFKERITYKITEIDHNEKSILTDENNIEIPEEKSNWCSGSTDQKVEFSGRITLETPLRLKYQGHYMDGLDKNVFFGSVYRRAKILATLYGQVQNEEKLYTFGENATLVEKQFKWVDLNYFSSRQQERMQLGGITGSCRIEGRLTALECSLLDFAELFHAGKNVSFGLGRIRIERDGGK